MILKSRAVGLPLALLVTTTLTPAAAQRSTRWSCRGSGVFPVENLHATIHAYAGSWRCKCMITKCLGISGSDRVPISIFLPMLLPKYFYLFLFENKSPGSDWQRCLGPVARVKLPGCCSRKFHGRPRPQCNDLVKSSTWNPWGRALKDLQLSNLRFAPLWWFSHSKFSSPKGQSA